MLKKGDTCMKNIKSILSSILAVSLIATASLGLTACGKKEEARETTVMNVSLNPEVEFILDADGKVVSVNALNEEGNIVISGNVNFVGKTQDEALTAFVEVTKDNGFLVTGKVSDGDNEISVSFSGDEAQKRYDEAKTALTNAFNDFGLEAKVKDMQALASDYLDKKIAEAMPYLDEAEITAKSYEEKIALLTESRKETAELYSEQLKQAYYDAKDRAIEAAKLNYVKEHAGLVVKATIETAQTAYDTAIKALEDVRTSTLVAEDSVYQVALKAFRKAKVEYLNYRNYIAEQETNGAVISEDMKNLLTNLDAAVDTAEKTLDSAYTDANKAFDAAKKAADTAYNTVIETIKTFDSNCQTYLDEASNNLTTAIEDFDTSFTTNYKTYIDSAKTAWADMSKSLKDGYQDATKTA